MIIIKLCKRYLEIVIIFLLLILTITGCADLKTSSNLNKNQLKISYIDVGQGDSILVQVNNKNLLIDAGPSENTDKLVSFLTKQKIQRLDYVIATHPHEDHIGGMPAVIKKYHIVNFYAPKVITNTTFFENMILALKNKNIKIYQAKPEMTLDLGKDVDCNIIAPNSSNYEDLNNYSVVVKLSYKNCKFLFMGDAQSLSEEEMLDNNIDVSCDVLKIGHHGSKTSSSEQFLDRAKPRIAIISCGKNNDYGHPHKKTLKELKKRNIQIYRTDLDGNIILLSDGNKIFKY